MLSRFQRCDHKTKVGFAYTQTAGLVNVKLKWVKDRVLDSVVARERDLKPACLLVSIIYNTPTHCVPVYHLSSQRRLLGLPDDLKLATFIRRYPTLFHEFHLKKGATVPWFELTEGAYQLHREELHLYRTHEGDIVQRLQKLLMLTRHRLLPLQTIDQLKWDLGLPYDYQHSVLPRYSHLFSFVRLPDQRLALKLLLWDDRLAVSRLQNNTNMASVKEKGVQQLAFPVAYTRGFGLNRKCIKWLEEWQSLPYTSPYEDASHLDSRTDVSEKRIVGVFHEFFNLMIQSKTERKNVSNLRKPLALPQKFTKVFARHPGIFYISQKCSTQTVILREAYDRHELLDKHPLVGIREIYGSMMKIGFENRSRGLYKKITSKDQEEGDSRKYISEYEHKDMSKVGLTYNSDLDFLLEEEMK